MSQISIIDRNKGLPMNKHVFIWFEVAFAGLGVVYACSRMQNDRTQPSAAPPILIEGAGKHMVTPKMVNATERMTDVTAPAVQAEATDGSLYDVNELTRDGPAVLVFIKDGCPCSQAAQPFFNVLFNAYGKHARFFGVFDGDVTVAKKWAKQNLVGFPILSDPDLRAVHEYKAENSAYVALIAKGGRIEKLWPGYSADMLADAVARLARLTGFVAKPIDARGAPDEMTTGCPY